MATNKKITQLDELTPATWADDDVIAIVDISAQETKKIQLSTFRGAVTGVSSLNASTPLTVDSATGDVTISVAINGGGTINAVFDEDDMTSNSPTALATQQSIKAYVDSQVGTVDTLAEILANGNSTGGTDIAMSTGDKVTNFTSTGIDDNATSTAITIDSSENVGIGTASPSSLLHLASLQSAILTLEADTNNITETDVAKIEFSQDGGATTARIGFNSGNQIDIFNEAAEEIRFGTDNSERMLITSTGNVGIGTSAPTEKLQISAGASSAILLGYSSGGGHGYIIRSSSVNPVFDFGYNIEYNDGTALYTVAHNLGSGFHIWYMGGTERMRIDSSGNVGIGTSVPENPMTIQDIAGSTFNRDFSIRNGDVTNYHRLVLGYNAGSVASGVPANAQFLLAEKGGGYGTSGGLVLGNSDNAPVIFTTNAAERMRIDSSGNVGIGAASPNSTLAITSTGNQLGIIDSSGTSTHSMTTLNMDSDVFHIQSRNSSGTFIAQDYSISKNASGASLHRWYIGSSEKVRIDSSGNVGIGISSPTDKLHVSGETFPNIRLETSSASSGDSTLDLVGYRTTDSPVGYLKFWNNATSPTELARVTAYREGADNTGNLRFYTSSGGSLGERMRITSSGNVGIGTSAPVARFVVSTGGADQKIMLTNEAGLNKIKSTTSDQVTYTTLRYDATEHIFESSDAEKVRITSAGNVGIGDSSPTAMLDVAGDAAFGSVASAAIAGAMVNIRQPMAYDPADGDGTSAINIITQTTIANGSKMGGITWARMTSNGGTSAASISAIGETTTSVGLAFSTGTTNTERMTINSSGDVGIGTSSPSTLLHLASTGNAILTLEADTDNVSESDNARIELSQDGGGTTGHMGYGSGTNGIDIWNDFNDYVRIGTNNIERLRVVNNGVVRPATDNVQTLGAAANRWSVVYAGTGTINTSDEREKQQIADLDDAERRVAVAIKGLVKKYKYNDAVALKGDDARIHVGVIAQEVIAAFAAEGLDATRYALLCHDTWEAEPEEVDKNGNVINPGIEAGERYGIRYDELLAFMIAAL